MIVVDASVHANALADDAQDGDIARARLLTAEHVLAPELLDIEVASVLRRRWLAGALSDDRLADAVDDLAVLAIDRMPMRTLVRRALELRENVTPYDAVYIALAEAFGCPLLTADRRLAGAPGVRCEVELVSR